MNQELLCLVRGCVRTVRVKKYDLCMAHYQQQYSGRPFTNVGPEPFKPDCPVEGCTRKVVARGLCGSHLNICWRMSIHPGDFPRARARGCDVCGSKKNLNVDHDHKCCPGNYSCGKCVRGWLCASCNKLAVLEEKDPGRSIQIRKYLAKPPGPRTRPYVAKTVDNHPSRGKVV